MTSEAKIALDEWLAQRRKRRLEAEKRENDLIAAMILDEKPSPWQKLKCKLRIHGVDKIHVFSQRRTHLRVIAHMGCQACGVKWWMTYGDDQ